MYQSQILCERLAQIDVAGERRHFLAVDQDLDRLDGREVDRQRVDNRVDREQLVQRAARVAR